MTKTIGSFLEKFVPPWAVNAFFLVSSLLAVGFSHYFHSWSSQLLTGFYVSMAVVSFVQYIAMFILLMGLELGRNTDKLGAKWTPELVEFSLKKIGLLGLICTIGFACRRYVIGGEIFAVVGVLLYGGYYLDMMFRPLNPQFAGYAIRGMFYSCSVALVTAGAVYIVLGAFNPTLQHLAVIGVVVFGFRLFWDYHIRKKLS